MAGNPSEIRFFYASIFDFGFKALTRLLQWIVIELHKAYTDGVNIVQLTIDTSNWRETATGCGTFFSSGSEYYRIEFSPRCCQISFDVRQCSWFNKEGKPIFADSWDNQYNGSSMWMYFDNRTQKYRWQSFERPDIEDYSEKAKNSILRYLKEKLDVN